MTVPFEIAIARVHDDPGGTPGARILVDRIWPRGVSKEAAQLDLWLREVAPSDALRKRFGHDPARWESFCAEYRAELQANPGPVDELLGWCRLGPVSLLFGARDRERNQAVVLGAYLRERMRSEGETA